MEQFQRLLESLSLKQKLTVAVAAVAVAAAIYYGIHWNKERDLAPLYTNLAPEDAGAVVEKLRSGNVQYKVREGGTILVPSATVAELRLEMAAAGLPKTGRIGFELFDKTNLGTSEFAEHINYRRAIEGELERSVMALAEVERARVHVTFAKDSIYLDRREPAKASVMVKLRPGRKLAPGSVQAVQHLAASAVEGLEAAAVSVLDMNGLLLSKPRSELDDAAGGSSAMLDYRQAVERDYLAKIRATLDPLLGNEKYRAGVSADCDFTSGEESEEIYDPNGSVVSTSQKTEDISGGQASGGGVPGTASNLPRPAPRAASTSGGVSRKTENVTYHASRTVKRLDLPRGTLRRISVAILVDQGFHWEGAGAQARKVLEPPSPERLKVVKDVVAGVIGFQQDRGDQVLVETLPFEATLMAAPAGAETAKPAAPAGFAIPKWLEPLMKTAPMPVWLGAGVSLLIVFLTIGFVLFKKLRGRGAKAAISHSLPEAPQREQLSPGDVQQQFEEKTQAMIAANEATRERAEQEALAALRLPPNTKKSEVLKKVIVEDTKKDPARMAQLVRTWLNEKSR